jgi:Family of unknown function (DUF5808)
MASRGKDTGKGPRVTPLQLLTTGLLVAAVVKELRTPAEERTWHGTVAGFVPYDLRPPTARRFRERWWAPDDERVVVPQPFGVGWTVNAGRVVALVRQRAAGR